MPRLPPTVSESTEPMKASVTATFEAREEIGHRAGNADLGQDFPLAGAERAHHVAHLRLDGGEPGRHVHDDREEGDDEGGDHRRQGADADPDHQDRHDRDLGDRVEGDQQRIEARIDEGRGADGEAQQQAEADRQREADDRGPERLQAEGATGCRSAGSTIVDDAGRRAAARISGTSKTMQAASQISSRPAMASQGMATSSRRFCVSLIVSCRGRISAPWWMRSRSSWTMSTKCELEGCVQRARGRGSVDLAWIMHDAVPAGGSSHRRCRRDTPPRAGRGSRSTAVKRFSIHSACITPQSSSRVKASSAPKGSSSIRSLGLVDQGAAQVRALLHAARELPGIFLAEAGEADRSRRSFLARSTYSALVGAEAALVRLDHLQRQQDVVERRAPGHQRRVPGRPCRRRGSAPSPPARAPGSRRSSAAAGR